MGRKSRKRRDPAPPMFRDIGDGGAQFALGAAGAVEHSAAIELHNAATGQRLGTITEADLQILAGELAEGRSENQVWYID